ncbi:MAG: squalene/phytoene synthase family protein [Alphaproteobacteria bacterium]|nr:squalene/phytoene synthase family protein [Alphaproteobacteria bacterium]MCB9974561.1 squalene/phytoene synthase family protein [Rhodospirillales bacterium]
MKSSDITECGQIVRENDPDRFLLSLFASPDRRPDLWGLFAFNHEIAKTREVVSDSTLGLIRLQWWRDEIGSIYAGERSAENVVLGALSSVIHRYSLPQEHFHTLLYAREFDLENVCPGNLEGLLNYCDFTSTPLLKLAVIIAGGEPEMEPVFPVAVNYALAGLLRSVRVHAMQERCYLPEDLMERYNIVKSGLFSLKQQNSLGPLLSEIAQARTPGVKPALPFLKAVSVLSDIYLNHLNRLKYNIYSPRYSIEPPFKALRLALAIKFMHF